MLKVKNQKTIATLAKASFKSNRLRNIFVVIAILLTTVLFTSLFTIGASLKVSMEESTMRQVGGNSHGGFKYLTMDQYNRLKDHPSIKQIGYSIVLGIGENPELARRPTEIRGVSDAQTAEGFFSMPTTGRLPELKDELATDTIVLDRLGITPELGQKVTLIFHLGEELIQQEFTLVGFWEGDILMQASQCWLSMDYVTEKLSGYERLDKNDAIGSIYADVNFSNTFQIEEKLQKVITDSGFGEEEIAIGVNWAYLGNSGDLDIFAVLGGVLFLAMIIFCGYLIISNIFTISIAKDVRFYGLLKAIGTTGKQIRQMITKQALTLCGVGIPFGLLGGYLVGYRFTPIVLSVLNTNVVKVSFHPVIFLLSILFTLITVGVSIRKPAKLAANVSPIEALRSTDGVQPTGKTMKKSGGVNLWQMAKGNIFRNKRKVIAVTLSLSLSFVILNSAYSIANSFDMDKYVKNFISSDFIVGDVSAFNVHINYANQDTLHPDFLAELSQQDGVEQLNKVHFAEPLIATDPRLNSLSQEIGEKLSVTGEWLTSIDKTIANPKQIQHLYGLDEVGLEKLQLLEGEFDLEKLKSGNYVMAAPYDTEGKVKYYDVGDQVEIASEDGELKTYEVLGVATLPYNISCQHSHPINPEFFLYEDVFLADIAEKTPMLVTLELQDDKEEQMENFLTHYSSQTDPNLNYRSKKTIVQEFENTQRTYRAVGVLISVVVGFIGIMNFVNTTITSIFTRRRELAMLHSIGMTSLQQKKMLILEGFITCGLTALFTLTVGGVLSYFVVHGIVGGSWFATVNLTFLPSILCLPFLGMISVAVSYGANYFACKTSVVDRLRLGE